MIPLSFHVSCSNMTLRLVISFFFKNPLVKKNFDFSKRKKKIIDDNMNNC